MTLTASLERGVLGEDATDLRSYLRALTGCPPITHTFSLRCAQHGDGGGDWFYVEADPVSGIARRRCMACAQVTAMLDSNQHWTYPAMHACAGCGQSLMELAVGLHADGSGDDGQVDWLALAARCVACGRIDGLTDVCVDRLAVRDLADLL
ncbi:MAG TPA: hypothetical protein VGN54_07180 [Mycobacteriales bacterium]|nr:hypothetical protein [Mycobacteriales bacterium]